jgi:GT2 family glycosyltransferase
MSDHGVIPRTLAALRAQTAPRDSFEVIVVDGGVAPDAVTIEALKEPGGLNLTYLTIPAEGGRAAEYNAGVAKSCGDLIGLLADDFEPCSTFVAAHLQLHEAQPEREIVSVGPALFSSEVRRAPFARWLEDSGSLFGASFTKGKPDQLQNFFYGGNAVLKRDFLASSDAFDERLPDHAVDDYELGLRLNERGMTCVYLPDAVAFHVHSVSYRERKAQMRLAGKALHTLDSIYPTGHPWNTGLATAPPVDLPKTLAAWALQLVTRRERDQARYYRRQMQRALLAGYAGAAPR